MDPARFDTLVRSLHVTGSRRRAIVSAVIGAGSLLGLNDRLVRGNNNKKKKRKKKKDNPCRPPNSQQCGPGCTDPVNRPCCNGVPCTTGQHCCFNQYCCPGGSGCDAGPERCCAPGRTCGVTCCDEVDTPCDTRFNPPECCPSNRICGAICCLPGEGCDRSTATPTCCPVERTCGAECCSSDESCDFTKSPPTCCTAARTCGDKCCDSPDQACCADRPTGDPSEFFCCTIGRDCTYDPRGQLSCCIPGFPACGGKCCNLPDAHCCYQPDNIGYCCPKDRRCCSTGGNQCCI